MCWTLPGKAPRLVPRSDHHDRNTIDLDLHRGMSAQHATEPRRHISEVEVDQAALRRAQDEVERRLLAEPAETSGRRRLTRRATCSVSMPPPPQEAMFALPGSSPPSYWIAVESAAGKISQVSGTSRRHWSVENSST
jgi:hypothetical protein